MLSKSDKVKIAARLFFQDSDDYENYEEAVKEMETQVTESFLDSCTRAFTKLHKGHRVLFRETDGHIATVRTKDDFFQPLTEMTEDEGDEIERDFRRMADENPNISSSVLLLQLQKCGWRLI